MSAPENALVSYQSASGDMPPDAAMAFEVYAARGERSLRKTASALGIPEGTVRNWSFRYAWTSRLHNDDLADDSASYSAANAALARLRLRAVLTMEEVMDDRAQPGKVRLDAATRIADRTGLTPLRVARAFDTPEEQSDVADTEIADAVTRASAGDADALAHLIARARRGIPQE